MKSIQSLFRRLIVCGLAAAMISSLAAQTAGRGVAKVVRVKGGARYTTGNNVWLPLKPGAVLKPGTVIQTADEGSLVDLALGDSAATTACVGPVIADASSARRYALTTDQTMERSVEYSAVASTI